jgi:tetratricopeptide (TPR) repeat protein
VVILEDLHNADKGTLEMLTHVSRNLAGTSILIIGTYRDVEVDRTHPLSSALAELRRLPVFSRVLLRGLNVIEVNRMFASITGQEMPWGLAEAIHRQTEGNPLFVQEVVRYLVEDGAISAQGELKQKPREMPIEMHIPDGLRDVIGKRLSSLSDQCNRVLAVASVIGREFPLVILQKVTNIPDEELFKALEEAKKTAVVEERTGAGANVNYRFAHAFFRQTLYEEIIAPRRIRLHQQVARAIEEIPTGHFGEHAAQLAEHFAHSSNEDDLKKAVNYGEIAGKRAMDVYAYGEAVRLLEQALKVQEILDPEDKIKRCDLLLDLCYALLAVPDTKRILDTVAPSAFSMAESINDGSRVCRACSAALNAIVTEQALPGYSTSKAIEWAERADRYAFPDTKERALADRILGAAKFATGDSKSGLKLLRQSVDLARSLGESYSLWASGQTLLQFQMAPQYAEDSMRLAEEILSSSRVGVRLNLVAGLLLWAGNPFLVMGRRQRAEAAWEELRDLATRTGQPALEIESAALDAVYSVIDGQLEKALETTISIRTRGIEAGISEMANVMALITEVRARIYLYRELEALEKRIRTTIRDIETIDVRTAAWFCIVLAHLGRQDEVMKILERFVIKRSNIGTAEDLVFLYLDAFFLESAVLVGHHRAVELLLNRFVGTGVLTSGIFQPTCIPRHLGGACALLGIYDEARRYYQEAIKVCTEMRFKPELALTRLQLAELLLEHYPNEKKEAVEHLDFAIKEFREMKMRTYIERALRHKELLKA